MNAMDAMAGVEHMGFRVALAIGAAQLAVLAIATFLVVRSVRRGGGQR